MKHRYSLNLLGSTLLAASASIPLVHAADGTWLGNTGNWNAAGTWSGGTIADGSGSTANFTGVDINGARTVTVDGNHDIGHIVFTDATTSSHDLTLAGSSTLTFKTTSPAVPSVNVTQSDRTLTSNSRIAGTQGLLKLGAGTLYVNGTSSNYSTMSGIHWQPRNRASTAHPAAGPLRVGPDFRPAPRPASPNVSALWIG